MNEFGVLISHFTAIVTNLFSKKKGDVAPTLQETAEVEKGGRGGNAKGVSPEKKGDAEPLTVGDILAKMFYETPEPDVITKYSEEFNRFRREKKNEITRKVCEAAQTKFHELIEQVDSKRPSRSIPSILRIDLKRSYIHFYFNYEGFLSLYNEMSSKVGSSLDSPP